MSAQSVNSEESDEEVSTANHRVVVFGVPDEPEPLRKVISELLDLDRTSATQLVRTMPGVVPQLLSRHAAARLASEVRKLGLNSAAIPGNDIPDLSHAVHSHHVRVTDEYFETVDAAEHGQQWPWSQVATISVGVVPSTAPSHYRASPTLAQSSSHRSWNDGIHSQSRHRPEVYVVMSGENTAYRLASDEMNFEYLQDRLNTSSSVNFRLFVKDLVDHSSDAWVTPSTRSFLDRSPMRHYEFASRDELRRYTEFQTLLSSQFGEHR